MIGEEPDAAVRVLGAGDGWFDGSGTGTVRAVLGKAVYVHVGGRLLALVGAAVGNGPLHLRLTRIPTMQPGERVVLDDGNLVVGGVQLRIDAVHRWVPCPLDLTAWPGGPPAPRPVVDVGLDEAVLDRARAAVRRGDLAAAAGQLGGRGPGLTPSGDDVLAGALLVDALADPAGWRRRLDLVGSIGTTELATAFLHWSALGRSIQPVHDLVEAVVTGSAGAAAAARAALASVGASSGAATMWGVDVALESPARHFHARVMPA